MTEVEVTIYCATYNHEKYIRDALDGFVMQETTFPYEVIVHDDASTDGTAQIIHEYEMKYPDIIKPIYQKENIYSKGIGRIYTYMLPMTKGKYIALCEGDDYWIDKNKLQKQYDYICTHPDCSLVVHEALTYYVREKCYKKYTKFDFEKLDNYDLTTAMIIDDRSLFPLASMFFRKDFYIKNEDFLKSIRIFDYGLKIMLAMEGTVHVLPDVMSVYRRGIEGSWTCRVGENKEKLVKSLEYGISVLDKINEYKEYKFDKEISENKEKMNFTIHRVLLDLDVIKKEPYWKFYQKMSLKSKLLLYIQKYLPGLYKLMYKKIRPFILRFI